MSPEIPPRPGSDKDELTKRELIKDELGDGVARLSETGAMGLPGTEVPGSGLGSSSEGGSEASSSLRGKLLDDLRAKQREDAENSSRLRGSLLRKIAKTGDEPSADGAGASSAETPATSEAIAPDIFIKEVASKEVTGTEVSRLRGRLLDAAAPTSAKIGEEIGEVPGDVTGDVASEEAAVEVPDASRLRGKLLEARSDASESTAEPTTEKLEPFSKAWLDQQTFVQRDGKAEFVVSGFNEGRNGELITLTCPSNGATVSLNLERFLLRLQTPGEAWAVKRVD